MFTINTCLLTLCFVAGKSGGHLLPCITQAEKIINQTGNHKIYLFSSGNDLDISIMNQHPKIHHYIPTKLPSVPYKQPFLFPYFIGTSISYFLHSLYKLYILQPTKIISFGGLNSIPVCFAGMILGIPYELYELNVQPGQSIQFLTHFTNKVYTCFAKTSEYIKNISCQLTSYPIRFTQKDLTFDKNKLIQEYQFLSDKKTILILGGSQGSMYLNQAIKECFLNKNIAKNIQIIHQTGNLDQEDYTHFYQQHDIPAIVFSYNEQLQNCYNLADLIICRAGSGTLFEVKFFNKPCIIIPLQTDLNNHQIDNAYAMQQMHPDQFNVFLQHEPIHALEQLILKTLNL